MKELNEPPKRHAIVRDHYATNMITGDRRPADPGTPLRTHEVGLIHPNGYMNRAARRSHYATAVKGKGPR